MTYIHQLGAPDPDEDGAQPILPCPESNRPCVICDPDEGDETSDDVSRCPACGDPIDYCTGHGEIGDPAGAAILARHDDGDHSWCEPAGCDKAGEDCGPVVNADGSPMAFTLAMFDR
jgi:hypothetical protein